MVWTIPLADAAGVLAVTFTTGTPALLVGPPVQRPGQSSPATTEPAEPTPPELPAEPTTPEPGPEPGPELGPEPTAPPADPFEATEPAAPAPTIAEPVEQPTPAAEPPVRERLLRPSHRRGFFMMSAGGATPTGYGLYGGGGMDFQMEAIIGGHTKRFPNFGGGFLVQFRKGFTTEMSFAGRLHWDRQLSKHFAIYSTTDFTFGINEMIGYAGYLYPGIPSALLGIGWGAKMIVAERLMLFFRPVGPNLVAPSFGNQLMVSFRWDVGGGIGVVW